MASGWIKGIIREIPSGDTVIVASGPGIAAPEKRVTLSSLIAPKLGKRDGSTSDEGFAWDSREFLRVLCIGKACTFKIDYVLEGPAEREFGSVFIGPKSLNVALQVAAEGWAQVRAAGTSQSPYLEALKAAEADARKMAKGIWAQESKPDSRKGYVSGRDPGVSAADVCEKLGKGKPLPVLVEQVLSGSTVRVLFLENHNIAMLQVCGVITPPAQQQSTQGQTSASQETSKNAKISQEAKHFVRSWVLNREARAVLHGTDAHQKLLGSLVFTSPELKSVDLGLHLVEKGLAKTTEWGLAMMGLNAKPLREAERKAKANRLGLWTDYVPPPVADLKTGEVFSGKVVEVVSGDMLAVKDAAAGMERRVILSSIRAPKLGNRNTLAEPGAKESREHLRRLLIGKEVQVSMEYSRKAAPPTGNAPAGPEATERQMHFATVFCRDKSGGIQRQANVAEIQLRKGYAMLVRHRADDERSQHYDVLMQAEELGRNEGNGLHRDGAAQAAADSNSSRINDISLPGNAAKVKQFLPHLTHHKISGVVEAVMSGNRVKVFLAKEGLILAFSPSGVRTPQRPQAASQGRAAVSEEPFWQEALTYTREHFLQRDVELQISGVDRGGCFLGTLTLKGGQNLNMGIALLSQGLAKLQVNFDPVREQQGRELVSTEKEAKDKRLKVWQAASAAQDELRDEQQNGKHSSIKKSLVRITDIVSAREFYIQSAEEPRIAWIEEQIREAVSSVRAPPTDLKPGSLCLALYSADKTWYRARVEWVDTAGPRFHVLFIDYGNRERVDAKSVRQIDAALAAVQPQAQLACLAYLKIKGLEDDVGVEAACLLGKLTASKTLLAHQLYEGSRTQQPLNVILLDPEAGIADSINAKMLTYGVGRLSMSTLQKEAGVEEALQAAEQHARKDHLGMWAYGDPGDDSDEEPFRR